MSFLFSITCTIIKYVVNFASCNEPIQTNNKFINVMLLIINEFPSFFTWSNFKPESKRMNNFNIEFIESELLIIVTLGSSKPVFLFNLKFTIKQKKKKNNKIAI